MSGLVSFHSEDGCSVIAMGDGRLDITLPAMLGACRRAVAS